MHRYSDQSLSLESIFSRWITTSQSLTSPWTLCCDKTTPPTQNTNSNCAAFALHNHIFLNFFIPKMTKNWKSGTKSFIFISLSLIIANQQHLQQSIQRIIIITTAVHWWWSPWVLAGTWNLGTIRASRHNHRLQTLSSAVHHTTPHHTTTQHTKPHNTPKHRNTTPRHCYFVACGHW